MQHEVDELDRPYRLAALAERLRERGEDVTYGTLARWAREGLLPVARVGCTTSTMRAYFECRRPRVAS